MPHVPKFDSLYVYMYTTDRIIESCGVDHSGVVTPDRCHLSSSKPAKFQRGPALYVVIESR